MDESGPDWQMTSLETAYWEEFLGIGVITTELLLLLQQGFPLHRGYARLYIIDYDANMKHPLQSSQLCLLAHQIVPRAHFLTVVMLLFQAFLVFAHTFFLHAVDYCLPRVILWAYLFTKIINDGLYSLYSRRNQSEPTHLIP